MCMVAGSAASAPSGADVRRPGACRDGRVPSLRSARLDAPCAIVHSRAAPSACAIPPSGAHGGTRACRRASHIYRRISRSRSAVPSPCKRTRQPGEFARCMRAFAPVRWYCIGAHALNYRRGGRPDEAASDT
ncbi:hypothetical protein Bamb_5246 [Burkholderia ambifaria AMMD]|uniref:Uncharacterized protein n=1 Tax=Burkholderia ambifaria (strain ATCC BAA-244 / DSM 16087 / CCUG 44356 / LMG 19182 / AMMD) TaxID=339670 RepID=Q0B4X9_BURCM|nr:hypothetical protein Bamb_5246 [Burkholderia ambifaria AMMD]